MNKFELFRLNKHDVFDRNLYGGEIQELRL